MSALSARDRLQEFVPVHLFSAGRLDRDLVSDFFMLFARAEFALKNAGFATRRRDDSVAADWNKFAQSLGRAFMHPSDPTLVNAVEYLQTKPPKKQVLKDGHIEWKDRERGNLDDSAFLVRSITTVRNNLFHGGKEIVGLMVERDRQLIQHSLLLLAYAITLNPAVHSAFSEVGYEGAVA
jgi:hypothetical protein